MERELLHKYFRGETSAEEEKQIMDWAEASPENHAVYLKERKIWNAMLLVPAIAGKPVRENKRVRLFRLWTYAAAAVCLLAVGISAFYLYSDKGPQPLDLQQISEPTLLLSNNEHIVLNRESFELKGKMATINNDHEKKELSYLPQKEEAARPVTDTVMNRLVIPHGKTYRLVLPDSTAVILNAESELTFPSAFNVQIREVTLKGEAFFQVKHNEAVPFIVHTEQLDVRVLGTTFNVSSYADETLLRTTLVDGSVQIEQNGETHQLRPSEQYTYNKQTNAKETHTVDTDIYTAWVNNEYIFRNAPLSEILTQIGHWYEFQTTYETPSLQEKRFSFTIGRDASLDQIIRFINSTEEVYIERMNTSIHIKNKQPME